MRIPEATIDEIRLASDIVEVISSSVRLKKRGKNYLGLCPFHTEKTPSFNVSPGKQMFHCFGCGVGGNVFTFLTRLEKISFPEAVRMLAERAGIRIPQDTGGTESVHEPLYSACRRVGVHYYENMFRQQEGNNALQYFHNRGFSDETIKTFGLGYSLNSWDDVLHFAKREGIEPTTMEKAGLVIRKEEGNRFYDRFRGRAMFPIFTASGRAVGFGARKLREDDPLAKYLNSPETPIYAKSRILYGLNVSKESVRASEFVVVVEGYSDLISLYQAGIQNVVATSGTALTEDQIRLVSRYTDNVTLVYDADSAGSRAMMRGVDLIIEQGLDVKVTSLPIGEDPDSFVRKEGADSFRKLLTGASSFLDFKVNRFREAGHFSTPEGQTRAVRSIIQTIARMSDELKRNLYIKHLSEGHGIYESVLFRELERQLNRAEKSAGGLKRRMSSTELDEATAKRPAPLFAAAEQDLLKLMVEHGPRMMEFVLERIPPEQFVSTEAKELVQVLRREVKDGRAWDAASIVDKVDDDRLKKIISRLLFNRYEISKGWENHGSAPDEADPWAIAESCIRIKHRDRIDDEIKVNQKNMKLASDRGEAIRPFLQKHQELMQEKHQLLKPAVEHGSHSTRG